MSTIEKKTTIMLCFWLCFYFVYLVSCVCIGLYWFVFFSYLLIADVTVLTSLSVSLLFMF